MRYVGILVEGETEEQFVKVVLNPYFEPSQLLFVPVRVGKSGKKGRKDGRKKAGGISNFHEFQSDLNELLRNTVYIRVTTMFDYYGLPKDFPGYQTLTSAMNSYEAVEHLEKALRDGINHPRFLPYLSLHEYEALLFSDPSKIIAEFPEMPKKSQDDLMKVRETYMPEEINLDNHPSKRLEALSGEAYRKTYHGILIAQTIGLDTIRRECQHFHTWLVQLEQLPIG